MTDKKKGDWDFKIDDEPVNPQSGPKKAALSAAERVKKSSPAPASPKKEAPKASTVLGLNTEDKPKRQTMGQVARRMAAVEQMAEITPAFLKDRVMANIVDLALFGSVIYGFYFFKDIIYAEYVKALAEKGISQMYDPTLVKNVQMTIFSVVVLFILHVIPSVIWTKSLGKKIFHIRIGHAELDRHARAFQIFLRECIAKPISILCVIGFILFFFNANRRSVYDFVAGTTLYIDD